MTLNKRQLCSRFRELAGCTHADAKYVVDTLSNIIIEELSQDNRVIFGKVGTFSIKHRKERIVFNPMTQSKFLAPARPAIKITPSIFTKQLLIEKLSQ